MFDAHFDEPYQLGRKTIRGRFVIPSGIRCTHAATIRKCFLEVPSIGVVTTKSISAQPRKGYREPIYARYAPGCYINAVGLANPGARQYLAEFDGVEIPGDKFLLVSIFGSDVESFVEAALALKPIADGFELNMSCPHAKGYGVEVGQDRELLKRVTAAVVEATGAPVFVKLSSTLADLGGAAVAAIESGATGLTLINTVGPALVACGLPSNTFQPIGRFVRGRNPSHGPARGRAGAQGGWYGARHYRNGRNRVARARATIRARRRESVRYWQRAHRAG